MTKLVWNEVGKKLYETGVEKPVLYTKDAAGAYNKGVAWDGFIGATESPSGAEPTPLYANNSKYLTLVAAEEFGGTLEAYAYPDEFALCDGSAELAKGIRVGQQNRVEFGLSYVTLVGNDVKKNDFGYDIHLIYGATAKPSQKAFKSINNTPEAITFSWEFSTTPVPVTGFKPSSTLTIKSRNVDAGKLAALENILYGSKDAQARLPLPDEVLSIIA